MKSSQSSVHLPALALLGALLAVLFFPRIAPPSGAWWGAVWDALHFPGFLFITWGLERLLSRVVVHRGKRVAWAALGAVGIAFASEGIHDLIGRSSSWGDVARDLVGIAFAVAVLTVGRQRKWRAGLAVAAVGVVFVLLAPAWRGALAARQQRALFPDLGGFEHRASLALWRAQGNARVALDQEKATLEVRIGPGTYGGVSLWPATADWRGHQALRIEVENPGDAFALGIRIDDALTDSSPGRTRYDGEREIPPGRSEIRIPLAEVARGPRDRMLDLGQVHRLILFTGEQSGDRVFIIVSAFLE